MSVFRYFVERKPAYREQEKSLVEVIKRDLGINSITNIRKFERYDIQIDKDLSGNADFQAVLAEPQTDDLHIEEIKVDSNSWTLAIESLPGQYNQRADSAAQCVEAISNIRPLVQVATLYVFHGEITLSDKEAIKTYLINPVECRQAKLSKPSKIEESVETVFEIEIINNFCAMTPDELDKVRKEHGLAMDSQDIAFMQKYYKEQLKRDPSETELKIIDTYWSDHCRHTTFNTSLEDICIEDEYVKRAYADYLHLRDEVYGENSSKRPITLMDIATIATKVLKKRGLITNLDESEEINACSVNVKVDTPMGDEDWLYMFKNETHNHPTEIEPFGGAATCLGGAIRDPLSGRAYVYQGLRLTGAANPLQAIKDTRAGKRPQRQICSLAAKGFSSYGNQIGLPTGIVDEIYHFGYEAKRMEVGAVVAAAPKKNVVRLKPQAGDLVVLVGGRTGRDGCGGATGSSKTHTETSLETAGSEVQKGNPVEERKIQRLFKRDDLAPMIKRCNDFGAGGVCVSVGELADGIRIYLDRVPKKYLGLTPTEIAISESQERMSCVIDPKDWEKFSKLALEENLEATVIAEVTDDDTVTMLYNDVKVVSLDRKFIDSAGASKQAKVKVHSQTAYTDKDKYESFTNLAFDLASDLNICSKRGLIEQFDGSVGASTVLMPLGGKRQLTPSQVMAAKLPVKNGQTNTASLFTYGFDVEIAATNPYQGAYLAVFESIMKLIASGSDKEQVYLTLQEYFPSLKNDPSRWGSPFMALLGALKAQIDFSVPAIGGKDSMSGSFEDLDVPPTLISFATTFANANNVLSSELKSKNSKIYLFKFAMLDELHIDSSKVAKQWEEYNSCVLDNKILSAWAVSRGGILEGIMKMAFGNGVGVILNNHLSLKELYAKSYGSIIVESTEELPESFELIGKTICDEIIMYGDEKVDLNALQNNWEEVLEEVYPTKPLVEDKSSCETISYDNRPTIQFSGEKVKPLAIIPVFPGTNCEFDTARQVELAGGKAETVLISNLTPDLLADSVTRLENALNRGQMLILPGGFSFGDEPDGSGKFIAAFLRQARLSEAIMKLLYDRDGLALGICNGFQALIKLGLLPYGQICNLDENSPTLTFNKIARHQSRYVRTRISSVHTPWFNSLNVGDEHLIPISHGEGQFIANEQVLAELISNGQVATQYVDDTGKASLDIAHNPNGSVLAIEGLISKDGRILGKMGHSERNGSNIAKNIDGSKDQGIFLSGVQYFS